MTNYWYFGKNAFLIPVFFKFHFKTFDEQVFALCNTRLYSRPSLPVDSLGEVIVDVDVGPL